MSDNEDGVMKEPKIKVIEKRASKGRDPVDSRSVQEIAKSIEEAAKEEGPAPGTRRVAPGVRRASEFFGEKQVDRPLTRGDYLKLTMMLEFSRRENRWYRKLWRWLNKMPQVHDIAGASARDHGRALDEIREQLEERLARERDA